MPEQLALSGVSLACSSVELVNDERAKFGDALGQNDAILAQQPTDLIDQGGAGLDESLPHPMQGLEVLRLDPFDRHKAHGGAGDGFTDGFGITGIVLR